MPDQFPLDFSYALGKPQFQAQLKSSNTDFIVHEELGFEPSGEGEHVYVHVEKNGDNTGWVAAQLARFAGVKPMDVGYAGLKDRNAVTRQWFSVYFAKGEEPEWLQFNEGSCQVLAVARHAAKLRRGQHAGNRFTLRLLVNHSDELKADAEQRLAKIAQSGVPNYFGQQRFGHGGGNLALAEAWFVGGEPIRNRQKKGLVLSAARSYLFNQVLSARIDDDCWQIAIVGEVADKPSGPLWGRGRLASRDTALNYEQALTQRMPQWCDQLEHQGLKQERRDLVCLPKSMSWQWESDALVLSFRLQPGQYATSVIRELFETDSEWQR
jgi:tRNA pseudouridine13 synthase